MNTRVRVIMLLVGSLVLGTSALVAQSSVSEEDRVLGEWLTEEGKAKVLIVRSGETISGSLSWLKEPEKNGKAVVDDKNPDEKLRDRPVLGLQILRDFTYEGDGVWAGGRIYDPESGSDYKAKMTLQEDGTLKLRGYILVPLLGRSSIWVRPTAQAH
jgi:uncharacterized protein (DUF2147 family)